MQESYQFHRVNPGRLCPICGKEDWCLIARDGSVAICPRIELGAVRYIDGSGWLHRLSEDRTLNSCRDSNFQSLSKGRINASRDFSGLMSYVSMSSHLHIEELAAVLGVTCSALDRLQVGYSPDHNYWTIPECDALGQIIGVMTRGRDGSKSVLPRSRRGLTYASDWNTQVGPVLLVEGASDTAAVMSLGISAIGRPSNLGGVPLLTRLLLSIPSDRQIIVIGERDQKANDHWPGKDGAIKTAQGLAERLCRQVNWSLPPDNAKDVRDWLNTHCCSQPEQLREVFLEGLDLQIVAPPPMQRTPRASLPDIQLSDYRSQMLKSRLRSLDRPGIYLDQSFTGAGKSAVDFLVIHSMWTGTSGGES